MFQIGEPWVLENVLEKVSILFSKHRTSAIRLKYASALVFQKQSKYALITLSTINYVCIGRQECIARLNISGDHFRAGRGILGNRKLMLKLSIKILSILLETFY